MLNFVGAAPLPLSRAPATPVGPRCCTEAPSKYSVGDKVRVAVSPMVFYSVSGAVNQPTDITGCTGTIAKIIDKVNGFAISATKPVVVKFSEPRFMGHFDDDELEPA